MLTDKIVLVTGASRGIGQAIALTLGKQNAIVIGTATSEKGAQAISKTLAENNIKGEGMSLNVVDNEQIKIVLENITNKYGVVDILVNNAGITRDNLLMRMSDLEWDDIIQTNLTSVFKMSKSVLRPMMKKRAGRIITIASIVGVMGNAGQTNYAAAKAGLIGFSKSLAREVANRGITVNTIAPGFIATDMTNSLPEEQKEILNKQIPMGRMGTAQNIADSVLFLASESGSYITGQTINVNGGMLMV
ncbi:3-oxoacyl-[acyl-carrier protein] reductase [hydrothermal vent metagenome]|uniref:3-oxoacyl-[acyl-carrier protein] reductase n=1 Tax=hydrothermal vent metagenome TaxID=652676 RepID=A0A1W1CHP0_9ZZZZ